MVLEADNSFKELAHIKKQNRAENGGHGQKKNCSGKNAPDLNIKVGEKCQRLDPALIILIILRRIYVCFLIHRVIIVVKYLNS